MAPSEDKGKATSAHIFGLTYVRPPKMLAELWNKICIEEGGRGYTEVNRVFGEDMSVNYGRYLGWFNGQNYGEAFDADLKDRVLKRAGLI